MRSLQDWSYNDLGLIIIFDPQNMGLETMFFQLSVILAEIWLITDLPIMVA
jgi:hypothetical protein